MGSFTVSTPAGESVERNDAENSESRSWIRNRVVRRNPSIASVEVQRDETKRLVEERGGRVTSSVSKNTSFVVVGDKAGPKADKAKELGVEVLTEKEFLALVN